MSLFTLSAAHAMPSVVWARRVWVATVAVTTAARWLLMLGFHPPTFLLVVWHDTYSTSRTTAVRIGCLWCGISTTRNSSKTAAPSS